MDLTSELLARLQKGESVQDLADELTKSINKAKDQYNEYLASQKAQQYKISAVKNLITAAHQIVNAWELGDDINKAIDELNPEDIVNEIDHLMPAAKAYADLFEALTPAVAPAAPAPKQEPERPPIGDPLEMFLNQFVRN